MELKELLAQPCGSTIQLKNGRRLFIEENDNDLDAGPVCYGFWSHKPCYFLKTEDGKWNHQNCPGSEGYCRNCYIKLEEGEPRPQYYQKSGAETIENERKRQIEKEGWTEEHDAEHNNQELIKAAKCYIEANLYRAIPSKPPIDWPWDIQYWKAECNSESINNLRKAGALIAAEIDRLNKKREFEVDYFEDK